MVVKQKNYCGASGEKGHFSQKKLRITQKFENETLFNGLFQTRVTNGFYVRDMLANRTPLVLHQVF